MLSDYVMDEEQDPIFTDFGDGEDLAKKIIKYVTSKGGVHSAHM